jgi:hypothetical protein
MSDKLTPEELNHYRQHLHGTIDLELFAHIAAVEAERDQAAALLRAILTTVQPSNDFGRQTVTIDILESARIWLAEMEREQTET